MGNSMEERTIIKSEKALSAGIAILICLIISLLLGWVAQFLYEGQTFLHILLDYKDLSRYFSNPSHVVIGWVREYLIISTIPLIVCLIFFWKLNACEITVTDKRVYGKSSFGKRVDLPMDSISAVGTSFLKGIAVATSSGKIKFWLIKNRDEIHKMISDLLIERQNRANAETTATIKQDVPLSNADELAKFKDLLDKDIITQEEFDAKKKQLLGL